MPFYCGLALLAIGSALVSPCLSALVSLYTPADRQGEVLGVFRSLGALSRAIAPIIGELAGEYGDRVKVVKMNIDDSPQTPGRYGVRAIPTILAFQGGQVVGQLQGARPRADFDELVTKLL